MNYTEVLLVIGRILYGGFFVMSGMQHFTRMEGMIGYAKSKNVSTPKLAVGASGALIVLGGLGVLLGAYVQFALLLIALFLVLVTFTMHAFWADTDPNMKMADTVNFWKNVALLGAALAMFSLPIPWPYALL